MNTSYQQYIHISRYARWNKSFQRRETLFETVNRLCLCLVKKADLDKFKQKELLDALDINSKDIITLLRDDIIAMNVMPSMRAMATAGRALDGNNIACYNCAYCEVTDIGVFSEILYILMHGTGIGFSVEERCVSKLQVVPFLVGRSEFVPKCDNEIRFTKPHKVGDDKCGWKDAWAFLMEGLFAGVITEWDTSAIRPRGALLKTFGGRASGPYPLITLRLVVLEIFKRAQGRKLTSRECLDIICHIAKVIIVGGQRRSALLALCDLDDTLVRQAKTGEWWKTDSHLSIVNISVVYDETPPKEQFLKEWKIIQDSGCGEPGIYNRQAVNKIIGKYNRRKAADNVFGCNPCSEILLRDKQFCNLSEVVIRANDTVEDILRKVKVATIIGTLQAMFTDFNNISSEWKHNCEEESLLGVSLTGIMDNKMMSRPGEILKHILIKMHDVAVETNRILCNMLGINQSVALSCIKPSGTVSQLVDSSSGIHPRYSKYYIRSVREATVSPICTMLIDCGVPHERDLMDSDSTEVFFFPVKSPEGCITRHDVGPLDLLEIAHYYQLYWCEHKISMTVSVKDDEWDTVGDYVFEHFDELAGVTFFPYDSGTYKQAPYEECSKERYDEMVSMFPKIDWSLLATYENADHTIAGQEMACKAGGCDL